MTSRRSVVRVTIVGEEYSIKSDAPPEHTRSVAEYVDRAITRVVNSGTVVESHKAAILAALQITDELFKAREAEQALGDQLRALSAEVRRWLPPGKRGDTPVSSEAVPD
jgi:cell division protein ZapA